MAREEHHSTLILMAAGNLTRARRHAEVAWSLLRSVALLLHLKVDETVILAED